MESGQAIKKAIPINWYKYQGNLKDLETWIESFGQKSIEHIAISLDKSIEVYTLEGTSYRVPMGYIIIRGIAGEYYPCDPQIFEDSYNITKTIVG